jgi:peroxiredoxin
MVILLGREVRSLRADTRLASERQQYMLTGMYIPRLELTALDGRPVVIGDAPAGSREVLFVYDTSCGFCRATLPAWNDIAHEAASQGYRVYGLSLDELDAAARYSADHDLRFLTLLLDSDRIKALLRAQAVPQTVVVEPNGLVALARPGALSQAATDSILAFLRGDHTGASG